MLTNCVKRNLAAGQSIIEIIIALAIFIIIVGSSVVAILGTFNTTRLAEEETQATVFASEGIEATQSIRNQNWNNITNGDHGVINSGGIWAFSGTSDDPDGSGKFTRVINITDVARDANGNIATSSGTVFGETKKVISTVTWNFTPSRTNSVVLTTYITNWQFSRGAPGGGSPTLTTCNQYCINLGYTAGTCRANIQQCSLSSETYKPPGDVYCTGGPNADTCCCAP